ncbi:MAG: hypothetical protein WKG07_48055 [Hymenobacter sp.]
MRISPPGLGMLLGEAAADAARQPTSTRTRAEYQARRDLTVRPAASHARRACARAAGGAFYVMAQLPVDDAEAFGAVAARGVSPTTTRR